MVSDKVHESDTGRSVGDGEDRWFRAFRTSLARDCADGNPRYSGAVLDAISRELAKLFVALDNAAKKGAADLARGSERGDIS